jgi:hypothetical protein
MTAAGPAGGLSVKEVALGNLVTIFNYSLERELISHGMSIEIVFKQGDKSEVAHVFGYQPKRHGNANT